MELVILFLQVRKCIKMTFTIVCIQNAFLVLLFFILFQGCLLLHDSGSIALVHMDYMFQVWYERWLPWLSQTSAKLNELSDQIMIWTTNMSNPYDPYGCLYQERCCTKKIHLFSKLKLCCFCN